MRIYGPNGVVNGTQTGGPRRTSPSGFSLPDTTPAANARPAAAPRGVANIDALMALQGVEDATERRKRAVKRGHSALDVLQDLKVGLLGGAPDPSMIQRLREAASELKANSGEPGLDQVLAEIELRVEVELAKAGNL